MSLLIKYNGKTIAALEKGQTATLVCEDKKMLSDVVVEVSGGSSENLISFTIHDLHNFFADEVCQAEEGMTWAEWIESDYNTGTHYAGVNDNFLWFSPDGGGGGFMAYNDSDRSDEALLTEAIVANAIYYYKSSGQGGGSN